MNAIRTTLPPLDQVVGVMRQRHDRELSCYDESFLAKSLEKRRRAAAGETPAAYLERLANSREEAEALACSLHVTYSEFFRNPLAFALLEQLILPSLIEAKGTIGPTELRVWSAGCAAGQEAWSVAILLEELAVARGGSLPCRIIATDVSDAALALARAGVYDPAAVQNVPLKHIQRYFAVKGESYEIIPRLKDRVDFSTYDLLDERSVCPPVSLYGDFDLILCCNLLFYYRPDIRQHILDKVCRALSPGGYFVTGEVEREIVAEHEGLCAVAPLAPVFQKKRLNHG